MSDPRTAVLMRLAASYDAFAEQVQLLTHAGQYDEANAARQYALRLIRAYEAEMHDPEPNHRDVSNDRGAR